MLLALFNVMRIEPVMPYSEFTNSPLKRLPATRVKSAVWVTRVEAFAHMALMRAVVPDWVKFARHFTFSELPVGRVTTPRPDQFPDKVTDWAFADPARPMTLEQIEA